MIVDRRSNGKWILMLLGTIFLVEIVVRHIYELTFRFALVTSI